MTLIEYCITVALLSFIMVIGLSAHLNFYNTLYIPSEYNRMGRMIETSRNAALNQEQSVMFSQNSFSDISSLLTIQGPDSITFSPHGTLEDSESYSVTAGLYQSDIVINSNGIITY